MHVLLILAVLAAVQADTTNNAMAAHDRDGQIAMDRGLYREAKTHFEQVLSLLGPGAPNNARVPAVANLGQACQELGEIARAEHLYRQALEMDPNLGSVWLLLSGALALEHRYEEAEVAARRAIALGGGDPLVSNARNTLAVILEARGRIREAAVLIEESIPGTPAGQARARMLANLGELDLRLGRRKEAVEVLQRSLVEMEGAIGAAHPDVAKILDAYGKALQATGHKREAKDMWIRAEAIRSTFALQANTTGWEVDYRAIQKTARAPLHD